MQEERSRDSNLHKVEMSKGEFRRFSDFIYDQCGVKLPPGKRTMLTVRLNKRLRALNLTSFRKYFEYVSGPNGRAGELVRMIDVVTTNKTDFFREPKHFEYLKRHALPDLLGPGMGGGRKRLNIWSAGCSSGEEPYTLAMVLSEVFERVKEGDYGILATDISTRVLAIAKQGIYPERVIEPIPSMLKRKYLMRGKGTQEGLFRMVPELRNRVSYQRLNLNKGRKFELKTLMDIIFCRNVIIYFDRETQIRLFEKFYEQLVPGGYLFIGHSETLHGINDRFVPVTVAVYRKPK